MMPLPDRTGEVIVPGLSQLCSTLYRLETPSRSGMGYVAFADEGKIAFRRGLDADYVSYCLDGNSLIFFDPKGKPSASFEYDCKCRSFSGIGTDQQYFIPALEIGTSENSFDNRPSVLINSIHKSGTYYLQSAFKTLGYVAPRIHLCAQFCDDHSRVTDNDMHSAPQERRLYVPAQAVAAIVGNNKVLVGHIEDHQQLDRCIDANIKILHCVRDLRDVLISLFRFKHEKVLPVSAEDAAWRALPLKDSFCGFLGYFKDKEIKHIRELAEAILSRDEPVLKFEDSFRCAFNDATLGQLRRAGVDVADRLAEALRQVHGVQTSTYSGHRSNRSSVWNSEIEQLFQNCGLAELNLQLGYDNPDHPISV